MEHVTQTLHDLLAEIAKQLHYENCTIQIKAISSGGANYMSDLYTATVSTLNKEELQLFAKVAVLGDELRTLLPSGAFDGEYFVYNELVNRFKDIEDKHGVSNEDRYTFCKYYGYSPTLFKEILVLENLSVKGFTVHDRMKSVDWPYASEAVKSLAKFHALSMAYGEQYPENLQELAEKGAQLDGMFKAMIITIKKMLPGTLKETKPENKKRLANFFDNEENYDKLNYVHPRRKAVLIHGDYRPSNLMHKVHKDGTVEVIPLDYQGIRPGCAISDLMFFIFSSSDQAFRAQHYEQLLEVYYEQLCRSLRALYFDPEEMYSREDFQAELKESAGIDIIASEMIKLGGTYVRDVFLYLSNLCWRTGRIPIDWICTVVGPLYKGKGSYMDCASYRAINLISLAAKYKVLPYGLVISVMILPIVTVKPEDAPDIHSDNLFESAMNAKTSLLYPDRLNGVIDDYVRWGII